jgi:hypothetical protein
VKRSEIISQFLNMLQDAKTEHAGSQERLKEYNNATQDILHDLELNEHTPEEKTALTDEMIEVRRERRIDKNTFEVTEKIKTYIDRQDIAVAIKWFGKMLGDVRKVEKYHENRSYHKKQLCRRDD